MMKSRSVERGPEKSTTTVSPPKRSGSTIRPARSARIPSDMAWMLCARISVGISFSPGFCNGRARGATPTPGGCANDRDGWSYYGRIGMDSQRGNIVIGAVGEFGKSEITDSVREVTMNSAAAIPRRLGHEYSFSCLSCSTS